MQATGGIDKPLCSSLQAWLKDRIKLELEEYQPYTVTYIRGKNNPADCLSRPVVPMTAKLDEIIDKSMTMVLTLDQVFAAQKNDVETKALVCFVKYNQTPKDENLAQLVQKFHGQVRLDRTGILRSRSGSLYAPTGCGHLS